jgi:hypothetical protein
MPLEDIANTRGVILQQFKCPGGNRSFTAEVGCHRANEV